jgi:hypothetical protein
MTEDEDEHDHDYARRAVFTPAAELVPLPPRQITETEWLQLQARLYGHPDHAPEDSK